MKKQTIQNAIYFLRRVVVHGTDQDLLFETVKALNKELELKSSKVPANVTLLQNPTAEPQNPK